MTPEQINVLINRLLETGQILATKGFELAERQVINESYLALFSGILLLIAAVVFLWKLFKPAWKYDEMVGVAVIIISAGISTIAADQLSKAFLQLSNPQWYAVKLLVEQFIK